MYGPSKTDWNTLLFLIIMGVISFTFLWLLGPPAVVVGVAWLAAPRMGWHEVDFAALYLWFILGWTALNVALIVLCSLPWPIIDFFSKKRK